MPEATPQPRRDLRDYALVRHAELTDFLSRYDQQHKRKLELLSVRMLALHRTIARLRDELEEERSLRTVALHDLALASEAKDPMVFIKRWERDHEPHKWGDG